eukprot:CAMPEP_0181180562 /NCGR_PEP_ID=MMETSP1096-20121128/6867_1 /TAXON_ID=156174 ORGANISM="Chrysochromulina ericina, Strain CCMP281" /NCGR_SAMPLE_ID=MMETSP1096 /ASSEMBLY_ACC=CAM_ASM_000453 /LENGTH=64 /DNA_ID=CAMNT_0023269001 /DNA_START=330 /DNA_END=524 /DNA_ORIENTATION=+
MTHTPKLRQRITTVSGKALLQPKRLDRSATLLTSGIILSSIAAVRKKQSDNWSPILRKPVEQSL